MLTISVAVVSFLAVPALCVGGVISHACDCVEGTCCSHDCGCGGQSCCGHESGCSGDPCSVGVIRSDRQNTDAVAIFHPSISTSIILIAGTQPATLTQLVGAQERPGGKKLPFPPSDLPLVI